MFILIVSPSLNPKSNDGVFAGSSLICFSFFNHLKWSCNATFKSNESDRSPNPIPMKAFRPKIIKLNIYDKDMLIQIEYHCRPEFVTRNIGMNH